MATDTEGELGTILGVWGHPDDEAYLSAGLMAHAVEHGRRSVCVTATKGEAGFPDDDPRSEDERARLRVAELSACLAILGVTEHHWLGYPDGGCAKIPDEEAAAGLAAIIEEVRPDTVLTFGPDGGTGHPDHIAMCRWTTRAVELAGLESTRLLYATKTRRWREDHLSGFDPSAVLMVQGLQPEVVDDADVAVLFRCDDDLLERKVAALRAQASQVESFASAMGLERYSAMWREEFFRAPLPTDVGFIERAREFGR